MRLADCRPRWLRFERDNAGRWIPIQAESIADAEAIYFWYPADLPHILPFEHAPPDCGFGPGRWLPAGTGFDDLTLGSSTGSRSVRTRGYTTVHFFVTEGLIEDC